MPVCGENAGDGGLDALMGIGDDQLDAAQAAARELSMEVLLHILARGDLDPMFAE